MELTVVRIRARRCQSQAKDLTHRNQARVEHTIMDSTKSTGHSVKGCIALAPLHSGSSSDDDGELVARDIQSPLDDMVRCRC